jgi:Ca2+-binding RTX toxin-like protein
MAVYNFSALADGQAITFDANADDLVFDQATISAAQLSFTQEGANVRVAVLTGTGAGKDVLLNGVSVQQLAQANVQFANGSAIRFGDNAVALNDDNANSIAGTGFADLVYGFGGNDSIQGNAGADVIVGGAGNDLIGGNNDNDTIEGNAGNDSLGGGGGQDTFVFREAGAANADQLTDFSTNWDRIFVDATAFSEAGAAGRLAAGDDRFHAAAGATGGADAEDRFVYNTTTRQLFYDADGNGAGASQLIATLQSGASLTAADITVIAATTPPPPPPPGTINGTAGNDSLSGTGSNDTMYGLGGNDTLSAFDGDDLLNGGDGNDFLDGGYDNDTLDGGAGTNDLVYLRAAESLVTVNFATGEMTGGDAAGTAVTALIGMEGVEVNGLATSAHLIGNDADNYLRGGSAADTIRGGGGNDIVYGSSFDNADGDQLYGEAGNDSVASFDGDSRLDGGAGNDNLSGSSNGRDTFVLGQAPGATHADFIFNYQSGFDRIELDGAVMTALGPSGAFSWADPRFYSASGATGGHDADDRVVFDSSTGRLYYDADGSGAQAAQLIATIAAGEFGPRFVNAADLVVVNGDASAPGAVVNGTEGNDNLSGTPSDDTINGLGGSDEIGPGAGDDVVNGGDGADRVWGEAGNDTVDGGAGQDTVIGGTGDDIMRGGAGDDRLWLIGSEDPDFGSDTVEGGDGIDILEFNDTRASGVVVDLGAGTVSASSGGNATVVGVENVFGTDGVDTIVGDGSGNVLNGSGGNDSLAGAGGADTLDGDFGNDTLAGGAAADAFFFDDFGSAAADAISDFASGVDVLLLDAFVMDLGTDGRFAAGDARFHAGAGATSGQDADDRIIYNTTTRQVFYDADGSGAQSAQLIATLQTGATLVATDVAVLNGSDPSSMINGTPGNDSLTGGTGDDTINGLAGDDTLDGSQGTDRLDGGSGNDSLIGGRFDFEPTEDGSDVLLGGDGNDTLDGWSARTFDYDLNVDTLDGGLGNDVFMVDNEGDVLSDAGGVDTVHALNVDWTLADGFENLILGNHNDFRTVGTGNGLDNVLGAPGVGWYAWYRGLGGNDTLWGTMQSDTLEGGDGNDILDGDWDIDEVDGGVGNDRVFGGEDDLTDLLTGGAGADTFYLYGRFGITFDEITDFASGADTLEFDGRLFETIGPSGRFAANDGRFYSAAGATQGHDADDRLVYDTATGNLWYDADGLGGQGAVLAAFLSSTPVLTASDINVVNGTGGQALNGTAGNDSLVGGSGHDTIFGNAGNDTLVGNSGNDSLDGGSGTDRLDGGLGDDIYVVTAGDVLVDAGGTDWVHTSVNWTLAPGFENAIMTGTAAVQIQGNNDSNHVQGNGANNYFNLRAGNDTVVGGGGNDTIDMSTGGTSSYGQDSIDGGAGIDTVDFAGYARTGVTANLAEGFVWGGGDGNTGDASLSSIERFIGGGFNDRITGAGAAEYLDGREGNDTIGGGAGIDTMLGGTGNDVFEFRQAAGAANADRVNDFASGVDRLHLDNAVMAALGADGAFASGDARFWAAAGANAGHDANDRVVYNTSTGQLWYDADGSGGGAAQLVATLQVGATVAATDISVI